MKDWFTGLEQREQIFVTGGAVVVLIAVLYSMVWVPLDTGQKELAQEVHPRSGWDTAFAALRLYQLCAERSSGHFHMASRAIPGREMCAPSWRNR